MSEIRFDGKVAIVTGAGRGIGRAIALALAQNGARVALAARTETELQTVQAEIEAIDGEVAAFPTDVTREPEVIDLIRGTVERFGRLDILINNAGTGVFGPLAETSTEAWDRIAGWFRPRGSVTLFYDDGCDFCLKSCHVLRTFLILPDAAIRTAQSDPAARYLRDDEFTWVVRVNEVDATKSPAMTALFRSSPLLFWLAPLLRVAEPLGNHVYGFVARHRGAMGHVTGWLLPWRNRLALPGRVTQGLAALFVVYIGWWNLATVPDWSVPWRGGGSATVPFPTALEPVKQVLRLDQHWSMFAPVAGT